MKTVIRLLAMVLAATAAGAAASAPNVLPGSAVTALRESLAAANRHRSHVWRDAPPINDDGTISVYVEIPLGERRKWEFDMGLNARAIDRVIPPEVGGYPVNYGFVPQTVSYDGDPFDGLVLGPPLTGGRLIRGIAVGLMLMEDEKGLDSKVVVSLTDASGKPTHALTTSVQRQLSDYFRRYKRHQPGAFSRVPGWRPAHEGVALVRLTHAFFKECRRTTSSSCEVDD
jgi:inorganic pyrophosphatase